MTVLVGVLTGVCTSLLASVVIWILFVRILRPKLEWCPVIARYDFRGDPKRQRSQVKLRNLGPRVALNITIVIQAQVPDLITVGSTETMPLAEWIRPILAAGSEARYVVRPELMPGEAQAKFASRFSPHIAKAMRDRQHVDLLDFLDDHPGSVLQLYVFATDSYSGAHSHSLQELTSADVRQGRFASHSCNLIPDSST